MSRHMGTYKLHSLDSLSYVSSFFIFTFKTQFFFSTSHNYTDIIVEITRSDVMIRVWIMTPLLMHASLMINLNKIICHSLFLLYIHNLKSLKFIFSMHHLFFNSIFRSLSCVFRHKLAFSIFYLGLCPKSTSFVSH